MSWMSKLSLANPLRFMRFSAALLPWVAGLGVLLLVTGLVWGVVFAPSDYQQGDTVRIMFVHVPAAWVSMFAYGTMALASVISLIWRHVLADIAAKSTALIGASFTFLALVTGMLWGKPMWGAYWVWDPRLTSFLLLFIIYIGYMAIWEAIEDQQKAAKAAAILAVVGSVNLPIVKYSVEWWNSLHQASSVSRFDAPAIHWTILAPLLTMALAYTVVFVALLFLRMRTEIIRQRVERIRLSQAAAG